MVRESNSGVISGLACPLTVNVQCLPTRIDRKPIRNSDQFEIEVRRMLNTNGDAISGP
jgi:hypothetical protein